MYGMLDPQDPRLSQAWDILKAQSQSGDALAPESNRLAFADPEFLLRRETRGIRFQLEMLKPDLAQQEQGIEHTVVVFGSARFQSQEKAQKTLESAISSGIALDIKRAESLVRNAHFYEQARAFGHLIAQYSANKHNPNKLFICTGGGPGIMEAANRGAHDIGAPSIGLNISLPHEQFPNPYMTPGLALRFHYFAMRKMHFAMRAKAIVAFPGGYGTLDEVFEVLTLCQTGKSTKSQIILFDSHYWNGIINFDGLVQNGMITEQDRDLIVFVETAEEAWALIG